MSDVTVQVTDDPIIVSVSNSPGPAGASSFFKGIATAWPPTATPTAGWIYTLPDPVPTGTPAGFLAGYGAQWDGAAWTNIGPVRGPAGPAGPQGVAGAAGSPGAAGTNGTNGTNGTAATITVGSVTTGAAGTSASVVNAGTSSAAVLNITIPRGDTGAAGAAGAAGPQGPAGSAGAAGTAATVSVGTVSTGAAGSSATVSNVGTTSAAVLNFSIPRGAAGAAGAAGSTGPAGSSGVISVTAPLTNSGTSSAAVLGITIGTGIVVEEDSLRADLPYIKTQLATVATSGSYADLSGKPAAYSLPTATASVLGGIKIGSGLTIDGSGVVTAAGTYTLPAATVSALGGVIVGTGLSVSSGTISVSYGITSSTACAGNDSRLSDARTPTDGSVTDAKVATAGLSASSINWVAITAWAASTTYAKGDLVEYLGIAYRRTAAGTSGATFSASMWQQITPSAFVGSQITSGTIPDARISSGIQRAITTGTAAPSGGSSGDIYLRYS